MPRIKKKEIHIEALFIPNKESGISEWKTREEILLYDGKLMGNNGNFRFDVCWEVDKYIWEIARLNNKPTGKVLRVRMNGYSESKLKKHPIKKDIREELLKQYETCRHCGTHKTLCIDHKNDLYNDDRVLTEDTQEADDFQVLCNKCNKDLKHQINLKEKKSRIIHCIKDTKLSPYIYDNFDYPWELGIREYDEDFDEYCCKIYTYWYDIDMFKNKREWYIKLRYVNKELINNIYQSILV